MNTLFRYFIDRFYPTAAHKASSREMQDIAVQIHQEFQDRSRKNIAKWRKAMIAAENPEDPRNYTLQDIIDDLLDCDGHLSSVVDIRKDATLNHRFYIRDKKTKQTLDEATDIINKMWFFDFLNHALDSILRGYSVVQILREGDNIHTKLLPHRNVCTKLGRLYIEVAGNTYVQYNQVVGVVEMKYKKKFGVINSIIPNAIWKRDALQAYAEFAERFGKPLITATTANRAETPRIAQSLRELGDSASAVFPIGADIKVHDLANAGNPEKTYIGNAHLQDQQMSKRIVGSTTITDEGANRAQTQVHSQNLDDKIATADKRFVTFMVNDKLFPALAAIGLPINPKTMEFVFDETEGLTLTEQWSITKGAIDAGYEMEEEELKKIFNLPIVGKRKTAGAGMMANFR